MTAFVVLSFALVVMILAVTVVLAVRLVREAQVMARRATAAIERLEPLSAQLREEIAVAETEVEHIGERVRRLRGGRGRTGDLHLDSIN